MRKVLLVVQYDGTAYHGFQRQPQLMTVQRRLEETCERVLGEKISIAAAGRTDAGVHAIGQAVAFPLLSPIPLEGLVRALNDALPTDVSVVSAQEVPEEFHPRYDCKSKLYSYRILNRELPSPFINRYAWHVPEALDVELMQAAGEKLVGRHDFASFCAAGGSAGDTVRSLSRLDVAREGELVEMRAEGDGFLYMMMRIIVGTLVEVGLGRLSVEEVGWILAARDRNKAGPTAPPQGLCLVKVSY
ncbi:MAG TPA: tRNA pseudouridine(38-40) synthase TruA [Armatimonadota bacterium]|nr:tRNA pseudouridine(38-40) synthase TruA [Armatimonadota bacterium]